MTYKIFCSYSTKDLSIAKHLKELLEVHPEVEIFIAEFSAAPSSPLDNSIVKAIQNCDLFILLWSTNSCSSKYVIGEVGIARGHEKKILPIVLRPNLELPPFVRELKYLEAYRNPKESLIRLQKYVFGTVNERRLDSLTCFILGAVFALFVTWLFSRK